MSFNVIGENLKGTVLLSCNECGWKVRPAPTNLTALNRQAQDHTSDEHTPTGTDFRRTNDPGL